MSGTPTLETQTTTYTWNAAGHLASVVGPATNQKTVYNYYAATGNGNANGMLQNAQRFYGIGGSDYLQTSYGSYSPLGQPLTVTDPASIVTAYTYDFDGMRVHTRTLATETTTYAYSTGGRLSDVTEPSGRIVSLVRDARGRVHLIELRDTSSGTAARDRIRIEYDDAGRQTTIAMERVNSSGTVAATSSSETATYEAHGFQATDTLGPQSPTSFAYDAAGLGELTRLVRGDGDTVDDNAYDAFQREGNTVRHFAVGAQGQHTFAYTNGTTTPEVGDSLPVTVTDPASQTRTYVWDDFGHLVSSTSEEWRALAGGTGATYRWYYSLGRVQQRMDPTGNTATYISDALGRITSVMNSSGLLNQGYGFDYDNPTSSPAVPCPSGTSWGINTYACAHRRGRLGRVKIYYTASAFWTMLYDYANDGQLGLEQAFDGRQTGYLYDSAGRLIRTRLPVDYGRESVAVSYDTTTGNNIDQTEVATLGYEYLSGATWTGWVTYASAMQYDAAGRLTSVLPADTASATLPDLFSYRTDGRLGSMQVRRRSATSAAVDVVNRTYAYAVDGSSSGYDSIVSGDNDRTFLVDGANRLTCTLNFFGGGFCPVNSTLVDSFQYGASDSRTQWIVSGGSYTRNYTLLGNSISFENRGSSGVTYTYPTSTGGGSRVSDDDNFTYGSNDGRTYTYDGLGRLRAVVLPVPTTSVGSTLTHALGIYYDHRTRPILMYDNDGSHQSNTAYYYDREDRLIGRIIVPLVGTPGTYTMESYVQIDPLLTGTDRRAVPSGVESWYYTANAPEGLPISMYSFTRTGSPPTTAQTWHADYGAFGNIRSTTSSETLPSPWRFRGQIELAGSAQVVWNGGALFPLREALSLNRWRAYDPHVGQYLSPDIALVMGSGSLSHPYAYVYAGPMDLSDPDGRGVSEQLLIWCLNPANAPLCAAILAVAGAAGFIIPSPFGGASWPGGGGGAIPSPFPPNPFRRPATGGDTSCHDDTSGTPVPVPVPDVDTAGEPLSCRNTTPGSGSGGYRGSQAPRGVCSYSCVDDNGAPDPDPLRLDCGTNQCPSDVSSLDDYAELYGCREI